MAYVDGFLLVVPRKNLKAYRRMAMLGAKLWRKHGAVEYRECIADDLNVKFGGSYRRLLKLKPGETAVFSWIVYKSKAHRNQVNARVMKDPSMAEAPKEMPFNMKRMFWGGFKVIVDR